MMRNTGTTWAWLGVAGALVLAPALAGAETERYVDERTGLDGWRVEAQGVRLQLVQRLPDQTRAFFLARGFERAAVERLAERCVLQTIVRNTAETADLSQYLNEWRVHTSDGPRELILKSQWQARWRRLDQAEHARIAFQWALLPTEQHYAPGDWNMGMTTYPFPPGTRFDLHAVFHRGERTFSVEVEGIKCAPDISVEAMDNNQHTPQGAQ